MTPTTCRHCGGSLDHWTVNSLTVNWCRNCDQAKCPRCNVPVDPKATMHCGGSVGLMSRGG